MSRVSYFTRPGVLIAAGLSIYVLASAVAGWYFN